MKMDKVLVKLYVPTIEAEYNVWLPINKKIHNLISLIVKSINELSGGYYKPSKMPMLYDKLTAKAYDINLTIKQNNIKNASELILI